MKKLLFLGILFLISFIGKSQKVYFIYLESEKAIPFYVKMGDRIYSSSPAGYLILSNLVDSLYGFSIGLSGKREVEPKFQVAISGNDHGFLIKEQDQKINLLDLQSQELIAPLVVNNVVSETYITRTDNFTRILSLAVNDPTILLEVVKREPVKMAANKQASNETPSSLAVVREANSKKPVVKDTTMQRLDIDTAVALASIDSGKIDSTTIAASSLSVDSTMNSTTDTALATATSKVDSISQERANMEEREVLEEVIASNVDSSDLTSATTNASKDTGVVVEAGEYKRSTVVRRSESSTTEGFGLTFIDKMDTSVDTIRIMIPNPKVIFKMEKEWRPEVKESLNTIKDIEFTPQVDTINLADTTARANLVVSQLDSASAIDKLSNGCKEVAMDQDYQNLRKEMAALDTDIGMINTAASTFKEKCFTTEQVRNLSALFSKAQWKFLFFEAVYKHVADAENFASLESEIKDDYYIYRFKALIAK